QELAQRAGLTTKTIKASITGKAPITPDPAIKLERTVGRPAHFWDNLERQYRLDIAREKEREQLRESSKWLSRFPVDEMNKLGWLPEVESNVARIDQLLRYFGIASPEQWETLWGDYRVDYRKTQRYEANPHALSAWLRRGEIEGAAVECAAFHRIGFIEALDQARSLTRMAAGAFQPRLIELCAAVGVAVVFIP